MNHQLEFGPEFLSLLRGPEKKDEFVCVSENPLHSVVRTVS